MDPNIVIYYPKIQEAFWDFFLFNWPQNNFKIIMRPRKSIVIRLISQKQFGKCEAILSKYLLVALPHSATLS